MEIGQSYAPSSKLIENWRLDGWVAVTAEVPVSEIVRHNEDHIRFTQFFCGLRLGMSARAKGEEEKNRASET